MTTASSSVQLIDELRDYLAEHKELADLLTDSLKQARANAAEKNNLKPDLFDALEWPQDVSGYLDYLDTFSRWAPSQGRSAAWTLDAKHGQQEVFDRLCHFYYLIDQPVGNGKPTIVQNDPWFKTWLVEYVTAWGSFLDTTASFSDEHLETFRRSLLYRIDDSMVGEQPNQKPNEPSGWLTFNQFFARELNPGLRPIGEPEDNHTVTMPADCTYKATYDIDKDSNVVEQSAGPLRLKLTHTIGSVPELLKKSAYGDKFANGKFVHYFLAPYSYHRFHTPVAGKVMECFPVHDSVYLDVTIGSNGQFDAPDNSADGYEFTQARGVVVIDTAGSPYGDVGLVAVIPVGMAQVSSVHMTMTKGAQVPKGEEFGYFLFGGSDIILLFQEGHVPDINTDGGYRLYGTPIADPAPPTEL
ncbi:phosphatidylserine decarboxylase [Streptoverticillium reticulum]|uniref:phosphatidylserine decarboxylase n=1 Tax=Streptoverticillium reticulum TaxID=1433415 RepID=UPI0039BFC0F1